MGLARTAIVVAAALGSSPALADNWIQVYDEDPIWIAVDKDSIRRGSDNLVYFQSDDGTNLLDAAVDCQNRIYFTLKNYAHDGLVNPDWRKHGRAVVEGSPAEVELKYACANAS